MERLTKNELTVNEDVELLKCDDEDCNYCPGCRPRDGALKKLKEYEDLEEQGLLLKLPYNIQTCGILYYADERDAEIYRLRAETIEISKMMISNKFIYTIDGFEFFFEDFGKIVFKTKAEAEAALERMGE